MLIFYLHQWYYKTWSLYHHPKSTSKSIVYHVSNLSYLK